MDEDIGSYLAEDSNTIFHSHKDYIYTFLLIPDSPKTNMPP
jgi:hypothetical protein